ncbi:MAG TPA: hypothetical protein VFZ09_49635 [Archangium sp.]|uniref:hypothetical protein n=1 Tax=Archangium sp. TaxID=1872627 RepID=UPI002E3717AD|nr:hypothetical protein [Archangium sp.]HEX5754344.1 hypothetical protein [Archangium sp.]
MANWMGWALLGGCVLCWTGCRKPEPAPEPAPEPTTEVTKVAVAAEAPSEPAPVQTIDFVELPEPPAPGTEAGQAGPSEEHLARGTDAETPPSRLLETDSESWERPGRRPELPDEERAGFLEAAEAARAGNASISATAPAEEVTIATGTVDGRVKRVRPGTIEVSDEEGNIYELRIDGRSRGLRQGRHIPLRDISEGTPVRASFDLVGGGESLARDIQLRR